MAAIAAAVPALQRRIEVGQADLGQKAERTQVHAEDGGAGGGKDARHGEQGSVASQDDDQRRGLLGHRRAVHGRSGRGVLAALQVEQRIITVLAQPCDQLRQQPGQLYFLRFADNRDANHAV